MFFIALCYLGLSKVESIKPVDLDSLIAKEKFIFVNFYCGTCPHSQQSLPVWGEISEHFQNETRFSFYKIDCDRYYSQCVKHGAEGFPVFAVYRPFMKEILKYNRDKDVSKFIFWVKQYLGIEVVQSEL